MNPFAQLGRPQSSPTAIPQNGMQQVYNLAKQVGGQDISALINQELAHGKTQADLQAAINQAKSVMNALGNNPNMKGG